MSDILKEICEHKLTEIEARKDKLKLSEIREKAVQASDFFNKENCFIEAIKQKNSKNIPAIIAEIKMKSPSKGIIREDFHPVEIGKIYEKEGASCISILTDKKYFGGKDEYLKEVRKNVSIPILRKDFILDEYQIYEAKILGADCILLIMACLEDSQAQALEKTAIKLGMDVLIEVHDKAELERALKLQSKLIGINNRNLKTMEITLDTSRELVKFIPKEYTKICESGIYQRSEIDEMISLGFNGFLIGESLMRQENIGEALGKLIS